MTIDPLDMPLTKRDALYGFATKKDLDRFATKEDLNKFATKDDLKKFATKEDLKEFATKEDLKKFATKEDLKSFATKEDLKRFATKEELHETEKRLEENLDKKIGERIAASQEVFRKEIDYRFAVMMEHMDDRFRTFESRIITLIDPILREIETRQEDRLLTTTQLADHENRITKLEKIRRNKS